MPVNGPWYDYAGFPKERRDVYYNKVRDQVEKAGYPVVDFSSHEYDKYFLKDTIHLGRKDGSILMKQCRSFTLKNNA